MSKETIEVIAESLFPDSSIQKRIFIKGAELQAERMYSEEEVRKILWEYIKPQSTSEGILLDGFLEQFKKKQDE